MCVGLAMLAINLIIPHTYIAASKAAPSDPFWDPTETILASLKNSGPLETEPNRNTLRTFQARATHYGESYNGQGLGCYHPDGTRYGVYSSDDIFIVAVGPSSYRSIGCGRWLRITGPAGSLVAMRKDACPGCDSHGEPFFIDLSEAGHEQVCRRGTCLVTVEVLE